MKPRENSMNSIVDFIQKHLKEIQANESTKFSSEHDFFVASELAKSVAHDVLQFCISTCKAETNNSKRTMKGLSDLQRQKGVEQVSRKIVEKLKSIRRI